MMHQQIQGSRYNNDGTYSLPCHLKGALPELVIHIEGRKLVVSSNDYVLLPSDGDSSMCLSGISGQNTNKPNHWIMGDVFFKAYYTVRTRCIHESTNTHKHTLIALSRRYLIKRI